MAISHGHPSRQLSPAFGRRFRWTTFLLVAFAIAANWLTTEQLRRSHERRWLTEQARFCAAALVPGPNGDLTESVDRLRARYERLVAVATLDATGHIEAVYPERAGHRRSASNILQQRGNIVKMPAPDTGTPISVVGSVVPLNGSSSLAARRVLVLIRGDGVQPEWGQACRTFAWLIGVGGLLFIWSTTRWFDRRVASQLRDIARVVRNPPANPEDVPDIASGEWYETAEIAYYFHELLNNLAKSNAQTRRLKLASQRELRQRERGFERALRRVRDKATLDGLTRLRNRAFFEEELEPLFTQHHKSGMELAAIMIDVDNFKQYNDLHGHQVGDTLLRFVGALLRGAVRPQDHAIRYGGDEFLLLLPETDAGQAAATAERLVKLFGQYTMHLEKRHNLSLTAGVASLNTHRATTGHDLIAQADEALYVAKRRGKNTVATYSTSATTPIPPGSAAPDDSRSGARAELSTLVSAARPGKTLGQAAVDA